MNTIKENLPWVLLNILGNIYAISCKSVISLMQLGQVIPIPNAPYEIRGVIKFRDQVISLVNMRKILNLKSVDEEVQEFCQMMDTMEAAHLNWLNTLEKSVEERTEFTLTTDPHKCAFGIWYDNFTSTDTEMMFLLKKFDAPHKIIHNIAIKIKELREQNEYEAIDVLIEKTKNAELVQMVKLFASVKESFAESKREISIVLGDGKNNLCISVDEVVAIEYLTEIDQDLIKDTITNTEYLIGIGKRKNGSTVLLLNDEYIMSTFLGQLV